MSYHSGFLLAVPTANRQEYADHAAKSWPMFQKRGALRLVRQPDTLRQAETVRQLVTQIVGAQARLTIDDLGGDGPAAQRVRRQALAIADAKASVLLLGESGTGKNILARAIHNSSRRAAKPFLAINCRAVPRELALQLPFFLDAPLRVAFALPVGRHHNNAFGNYHPHPPARENGGVAVIGNGLAQRDGFKNVLLGNAPFKAAPDGVE